MPKPPAAEPIAIIEDALLAEMAEFEDALGAREQAA